MKFYIAGAFGRKFELHLCAERLRLCGHRCTSRWIYEDQNAPDVTGQADLEFLGPGYKFATQDIEDIIDADGLIFFSSHDHEIKGRGGRHTELGIALMLDKMRTPGYPIYLIGRREHAFHALIPLHNCYPTFDEFLGSIVEVKNAWRYALLRQN